ncbi:Mitochondrial GTPase 1 [Smittium culicis]|uniref:Mitochondrial GTPase 1 n=1 Tax=Smittium culicis TaxID=133412 RepID=A0A1R1Y6B2_9FUNG|nr:Mitochondrial GTPase 1 [Smittium culicis]
MIPYIPNPINSLKIALTGGIRDNLADYEIMADYLLYRLNSFGSTNYVKALGLSEPTDNIDFLLNHVAKRIGALQPGGVPLPSVAARFFINQYRLGKYGLFCLDDISYLDVVNEIDLNKNSGTLSKNQARKLVINERKLRNLEKFNSRNEIKT